MLTKKKKQNLVKKSGRHDKDTGSPEVQVSVLTEQINELTKHLKIHGKDNHSRRGLLKMVAKRRSHMKYLEKHDKKKFAELSKKTSAKSKK